MRPFLSLTVSVSSALRGLWPDLCLAFQVLTVCLVVCRGLISCPRLRHFMCTQPLSLCVLRTIYTVEYIQYVRRARPGAANRALLYSTFTVTTKQSIEQPQTAVRSVSGLYKDPVRKSVPRSKHNPSQLQKPTSQCCTVK